MKRKNVALLLRMHTSFVSKVINRFLAGRLLNSRNLRVSRTRALLTPAELVVLQQLLAVDDTLFLDELRDHLANAIHKRVVSIASIFSALLVLGFSRKKSARPSRLPAPQLTPSAAAVVRHRAQGAAAPGLRASLLHPLPPAPLTVVR